MQQPESERPAGFTSTARIVIGVGAGERVYGVLRVHSIEPHIFSEDEVLFLEAISLPLAHVHSLLSVWRDITEQQRIEAERSCTES